MPFRSERPCGPSLPAQGRSPSPANVLFWLSLLALNAWVSDWLEAQFGLWIKPQLRVVSAGKCLGLLAGRLMQRRRPRY